MKKYLSFLLFIATSISTANSPDPLHEPLSNDHLFIAIAKFFQKQENVHTLMHQLSQATPKQRRTQDWMGIIQGNNGSLLSKDHTPLSYLTACNRHFLEGDTITFYPHDTTG